MAACNNYRYFCNDFGFDVVTYDKSTHGRLSFFNKSLLSTLMLYAKQMRTINTCSRHWNPESLEEGEF